MNISIPLYPEGNDDKTYEPEKKKEKLKRKKLRLEETILAGERCGLSDPSCNQPARGQTEVWRHITVSHPNKMILLRTSAE